MRAFDEGLLLYGDGKYDEAVERFGLAVRNGDRRAFSMRAACLQAMERHQEAIEDLAAAIDFEPTDCNTFFMRAQSHRTVGSHEEALADLQAAIQLAARDTPLVRQYDSEAIEMGWATAGELYRYTLQLWELEAKIAATDPKWLRKPR